MRTKVTKLAKDISPGDTAVISGKSVKVTDVRPNRRYAGYMAIQYRDGERITQADIRSSESVELV